MYIWTTKACVLIAYVLYTLHNFAYVLLLRNICVRIFDQRSLYTTYCLHCVLLRTYFCVPTFGMRTLAVTHSSLRIFAYVLLSYVLKQYVLSPQIACAVCAYMYLLIYGVGSGREAWANSLPDVRDCNRPYITSSAGRDIPEEEGYESRVVAFLSWPLSHLHLYEQNFLEEWANQSSRSAAKVITF